MDAAGWLVLRLGAPGSRQSPTENTMRQLTIALTLALLMFVDVACVSSARVKAFEDPVDGTVHGFVMYLDQGHYTAIASKLARGRYTLEVMVVMRGNVDVTMPPGTPVLFKVGDELMEFPSNAPSVPVTNTNTTAFGPTIFTQWKFKVTPTVEDMLRLGEAPLRAVRVTVANEELTLVPTPGQGRALAENFNELASRQGLR